ncbi:WS/DGAT domain-containing protein [Lentzea alba]|uniref:wax ester/triacylglycerol synthase domain-containing protein n=1 Tax=Lentzea alba TaxID=2714351 RepID=UPI0039BF2203
MPWDRVDPDVPGRPVIDRASPTDRAFLAMDDDRSPAHFGVILLFGETGGFDVARGRQVLAERVAAVPRLRQRLVRTPFGCGGPIWVDDEDFDIENQVRVVRCAEPGDERALLDTAYALVSTPLARNGPRWSAVFVTGLVEGAVALVVVLHHVLADGVGGLAILAGLADPGPRAQRSPLPRPGVVQSALDGPADPGPAAPVPRSPLLRPGVVQSAFGGPAGAGPAAPPPRFPQSRPGRVQLALDALSRRVRAVLGVGTAVRLLRASMAAAGGVSPQRATPCSLLRRTGGRGRPVVVRVPVASVRAAAHRCGGTTNDAILVAVASALNRVLRADEEELDTVVIGVPVSGHASGEPARGNMVSPLLVAVPATGDLAQRLRSTAGWVRTHKAAAQGPPPIALLGWLFRPLAALGAYRWYMNHQNRMHTLVSHVRGPSEPITFAGRQIRSAIPMGVGADGNMTVYFEVFTYAGIVTITAIADPVRFPDLDVLAQAVSDELARMGTLSPGGRL